MSALLPASNEHVVISRGSPGRANGPCVAGAEP